MKQRIKVLHLQPECSVRISDLQEEIIAALPVERFEVVTAYLTKTPETSSSGMHSQSERVKYFNFQKKDMKGLRIPVMRQLLKFCRTENFDVVITHRFKALDIMLKLNKLLKIPHCIGVIHNLDDFSRFYRRLNAFLFLDKRWTIVTVSQLVNEHLCAIGFGFNQQNVKTINNAIDTQKLLTRLYSREQARKELKLDKDSFVFGTIGRAVTVKGHIYLLRAFNQLYQSNKNIKLVIIGGGKLSRQLQDYIDAQQLNNAVYLTGEIVDAKLLIAAFDAFVLSSLAEGFSLVVLEAMAAGVPLIATQVGVVPDIITDKDEYIEPKDIQQLAYVMKKYCNMPIEQRQLIGAQLLHLLEQQYDIRLYRKNYLQLVQSKLKQEQA